MSSKIEENISEKNLILEPVKKKKKKIQWSKGEHFIVGFVMIYFLFFGFICNTSFIGDAGYQKEPGNKLLFLYTAFTNTDTIIFDNLFLPGWLDFIFLIPVWASIFVFFGIGIIQSYQEDFLVYAIKNNLLMVPVVIVMSWIWYAINYHVLIFYVIWWYFTSLHGYLNIIVLTFIYGLAGFIGGYLKIRKYEREHAV